MKQINLLPKPTFIEQYKKPLSLIVGCVLFLFVGLYSGYSLLKPLENKPSSAFLPTSSTSSSVLKCSIDKIKVIGYLCKGSQAVSNQCWCVIKAPDGEISALKVGDFVGYEKAEVTDIKPTGIYLNVPSKKDLVFIPAKTDQIQ